jgi:hypothetical protein
MFAVDTLEYSEEFEKAKFTKAQSKILASKIKEAQEDSIGNLVTKNELKLTEKSIKAEIQSEINKATLRIIIAIPAIVTFINYLLK